MGIYEYQDSFGEKRIATATSSRALAGQLEGQQVDFIPESIRIITKELYTPVERERVRNILRMYGINPHIIAYIYGL